MNMFLLSNDGSVIHESSGVKYQVFICQKKMWFICATERDLFSALNCIKNLAEYSYKKVADILSKYNVYWSDNAAVQSTDKSFKGFNRYDTKDICNIYDYLPARS